jgi:hypothetical protein
LYGLSAETTTDRVDTARFIMIVLRRFVLSTGPPVSVLLAKDDAESQCSHPLAGPKGLQTKLLALFDQKS